MRTPVDEPLVTMIATCFNHDRFVEACLESVRAQTYRNTELIICDDASTDRSPEIIRTWVRQTGVPCRLILHSENRGLCATLNEALSISSGSFIGMVATDDLWMPNKTELQVRAFQEMPESVGVLYSDALVIDERGSILPQTFIKSVRSARWPRLCAPFKSTPEGDISRTLLRGNFIPAMTTLIRKKCLDEIGPYDEQLAYEDFDMWLRISRRFQFRFSPTPLAYYRVLPTSLSRTMTERGAVSTLKIYQKWLSECGQEQALVRSIIAERAFGLAELLPDQRTYYRQLGLSHARRPRSVLRAGLGLSGVRMEPVRSAIASLMSLLRQSGHRKDKSPN